VPIRRELRWLYPIDWPQISREVRFRRAGGRCQHCGRPHGAELRCLPDGRWFDNETGTWRDAAGAEAAWPDVVEATRIRRTRVVLAACHRNHDPSDNRPRNLVALCQRCHLLHDRHEHRRRARITVLLRRAIGDLFLGRYRI
jgi:hypothetical protein